MKLYLNGKILITIIVSFITIVGLGITSYFFFNRIIKATDFGSQSREILYHTHLLKFLPAEINDDLFSFAATGNEIFFMSYKNSIQITKAHLKSLDSLLISRTTAHNNLITLDSLFQQKINSSEEMITGSNPNTDRSITETEIMKDKALTDNISELIRRIEEDENILIRELSLDVTSQFYQFVFTFFALIVCMVLILGGLTYIINANLRSLSIAMDASRLSEQKAIRTNKELESFTYSVSHDLRAPLRSISGYGKMLTDKAGEQLDNESRRYLNVMLTNARNMGQLIDDLLNFSRINRVEVVQRETDMKPMVNSIISDLLEVEKERDIRINIGTLEISYVDHKLIRQVWVNLLSNAVKYTKGKKSAVIEVGSSANQNEAIYFVKDNGVGFNMQYANKLFEVFQRLHTESQFEGTGVGLAIVKGVIDKHKGRVWAESDKETGTVFYFSIPK